MASVYVIQGFDQGVRKDIEGKVFRIGRDSSNHLQLHDSEVSRFHAEIRVTDEGMEVNDIDSSNGTFVNGTQSKSVLLHSGDRLQIGRTHLIYSTRQPNRAGDLSAEVRFDQADESLSRILKSATPSLASMEAMEDGSSVSRLDDMRRHLEVMYRTTMAVSQTLDIDLLLERLLDLIFEWVEADRGCIILVDEKSQQMVPKVSRYREGLSDDQGMIISQRILDYVMEHNEGVLTTDAREDERWEAAGSIVGNHIKEAICVPLSGRYGVVGVIYIDTSLSSDEKIVKHSVRHFNDEHLKMMIAIAHQAALAIEDTQYYSSMVQSERLAAIGQTITAISHHIKNIIQGVKGGSYLVEEGLRGNDWDTLQKGWAIVQRNQERISNLVLDMLTVSKERRPEITSSNLNHVAEDVVDILRNRAREEGTELLFESLPGIHQFLFDPDGIHRALLNVVSNALDAVKDQSDGRVAVFVDHDMTNRILQVIVSDNGSGIDPDRHEQIFHAFVSGKGGRGTGLGLAVSRKILREHDGDITIDSDGESGTSFKLYWPSVSSTERVERLRDSSVVDQKKLS